MESDPIIHTSICLFYKNFIDIYSETIGIANEAYIMREMLHQLVAFRIYESISIKRFFLLF